MSEYERTHCAHCGKMLNDEQYAVEHLMSVHDVSGEDARDAVRGVEWHE